MDDVDFVPEGSEIHTAPIDSREAIIATGALAVITVVSVDQYGQAGVSNLLSTELRRAMTEKADHASLSQADKDFGARVECRRVTPAHGWHCEAGWLACCASPGVGDSAGPGTKRNSRGTSRHGIASAQAMCAWKPSVLAMSR